MEPHMDIQITTRTCGQGKVLVSIVGELDVSTTPKMKAALAELTEGGCERILVDMSGVPFMDSTALGALVGALKRLRERGGELELAALQPGVRRVFDITRLESVFRIHESVEQAA
jgi:anti-sigma B factor antagonist